MDAPNNCPACEEQGIKDWEDGVNGRACSIIRRIAERAIEREQFNQRLIDYLQSFPK